jgi:Glycosyltransferase
MKISFIIYSMGPGGAERTAGILANAWAAEGKTIELVTLDGTDGTSFYRLSDPVRRVRLPSGKWPANPVLSFIARVKAVRAYLKTARPHIVLSFLDHTNVTTLIASIFLGIPVVVTEHTDPRRYALGWQWRLLREMTYPFAKAFVAVSRGVLEAYPLWLKKKGRVIYNPVDESFFKSISGPESVSPRNVVISIGRLDNYKGFDLLIKAFKSARERKNGWTLEIWGDGPARPGLEKLITELGLEDTVFLRGLTSEPAAKLRSAALFVLPSRYEGFSIVIAEALASGLPVISFDCRSGPREILSDGRYGVLVPPGDIEALSEAMSRLMSDEGERKRLAAAAPEAASRFSTAAVLPQWKALFNGISENKE